MRITQDQICELWKLKVAQYGKGRAGALWGGALFVLGMLFMPAAGAGFTKQVVVFCISIYGAFLLMTIIALMKINKIKASRYREKDSYSTITLLNASHNVGVVTMIFVSFLATGIILQQRYSMLFFSTRIQLLLWMIASVVSVLLSPWLIKRGLVNHLGGPGKKASVVLVISRIVPAMGILIGAFLARFQDKQVSMFVVMIVTYFGAMFLLPGVVSGTYEIILLGLGKRPEVKRNGSGFAVTYPPGEQTDDATDGYVSITK